MSEDSSRRSGACHKRSKPPQYKRLKRKGKSDSAVCHLNDKRIFLGVYGSPESRQKFAELVSGNHAEPTDCAASAPSTNPTVNEMLIGFFEYAQIYYRTPDSGLSEEYHHNRRAAGMLRNAAGEELAEDIGPKRLKLIREEMIAKGWARSHINGQFQRLVRIFRWATSEELVPASVYDSLRSIEGLRKGRSKAKEAKVVRPVDDAIVEATLEHLPQVVGDMVRFQRLTGCRPGEMVILRPCDIDRAGEVWFYTPSRHKTEHHGHSRVIAIGPKAQDILRPLLARDVEMYCFRPRDSEAKRLAERHAARVTPMSCGNVPRGRAKQPGDHYSVDSYRRAITRACSRAGEAPWTPHRLRHSAATEVRREFGLDAAQSVLGHKSASITEVYAELDREKAADVARKIG